MDITFKNVSYTYQPNTPFEHNALKNVSFHIPSGSFIAIIGHTGSGKSTLIQHLNGLLTPTKGEVKIGNYTLSSEKKLREMKELRSKVGVVFQYPEHQLFEETVEKDIAFGPENFGVPTSTIKKRIEEIMPKVGLSNDFLSRSPFELSGGQMRRVAIAGVLATNPSIYVLDEPTAGLDPKGQKEMMDMFYQMHQEEEITTILVTHSMEDALKYADYIIILNQGEKYMEGKPEEVFLRESDIQKVHLQVPESIQFLKKYNEKFGTQLPLTRQSTKEIAAQISRTL
ncbi:energy-coupling factor ABC transporter ATP-binding protein [Pseudogracilibacillus auburnensis]|uniref:Energy-coupling factor transporter ATP-binding protein EcfA2 n=1 Tax=Pseudogracilibacillus auburnensis TaxID=1494959 RepID=A0A2V3VSK2_9BACI|nr:energy-coupling factor ABC transporter ATP-binding protein [Pseudogracilibacillus auburnensis]PXW84853.1 energy-coupling factor transport system ATP-binding protein [Pseudogracilibacillus auburnensis]